MNENLFTTPAIIEKINEALAKEIPAYITEDNQTMIGGGWVEGEFTLDGHEYAFGADVTINYTIDECEDYGEQFYTRSIYEDCRVDELIIGIDNTDEYEYGAKYLEMFTDYANQHVA